jgi:putative polyketide hydroxylase
MSDNPEVLIIGGGPVGLSAALALGRAGISCLVLERRTEFSRYPKANGVHARTMEIFREWGVADSVRALTAGMPDEITIAWMTRLNGIEIGQLVLGETEELSRLFDGQSPERMSAVGQHMFEPVLAKVAGELDSVTIRLGCEVVDLNSDEGSVTAAYIDQTGARRTVVAQYVIGADGLRSAARRTLGIGEHGEASLGTAINVQFDADLDPLLGGLPCPIIWIVNGDTQGAFIRDSPTRWRYNFEIPPGADPDAVTRDRCVREVADAIGAVVPVEIHHIWSWGHDQAVADRWRDGRVFLAGDAAHHFPPHGGFGLNSGIQDVHNLVWKLIARLRWGAGDGVLESYEVERLPVAEFNAEKMMENTRQMEKTGFLLQDKSLLAAIETDAGADLRRAIAEGIPAQRDQLASHGQQFGYQYASTAIVPDGSEPLVSGVSEYRPTARPGARAPHSWVRLRGERISTVDVYDGGFVLLTGPDNAGWVKAAEEVRAELAVPLTVFGLGTDLLPVDERIDELLNRYGLEPSGAVLVRPDGFVGFRSTGRVDNEHRALSGAMRQILDLHTLEESLLENKAVRLRKVSPGCFTVVIDNPPYNLVDSQVFAGLQSVRSFAEDPANDVRVLVFKSANPEFFLNHVGLVIPDEPGSGGEVSEPLEILQGWPALSHWLSSSPVVTIVALRGRAWGFGCEFALSADLRFASKENTRLCLLEVGFGALPGGGGLEWGQLLAGRARAMEFMLSSDDLDADILELYGLVNRSIPDAELDTSVDKLARRIASFNPAGVAMAKSYLTKRQPIPLPADLAETSAAAGSLLSTAAGQAVVGRLVARAGGVPFSNEVELDLPKLCDVD